MRLIVQIAAIWLAGCSMFGGSQLPCKILDPDLSQGVYRGSCKDGWSDGYGEVSGISSYRGDFQAGKKHGKGIKVMPNGDRYTGGFRDDFRHGQGIYEWGENTQWAGDRYEGEYQHDLRHGWGIFKWKSGDRYEGQWQHDLRMGPSVMEQRRAQTAIAIAKSEKTDAQLCAEEPWDTVNIQLIRGRIEEVAGDSAKIRIIEVEGGFANYQGATLTSGDLFTDRIDHWQPCEKN